MDAILLPLADLLSRLLTSPAFWIILLILLCVGALVLLYRNLKLRALGALRYERRLSTDGIFVGDEMELTEILRNPTRIPLLWVRVDFFMPSGLTIDGIACKEYQKLTSVFHIPPLATLQKTHRVQANRRGHYHLQNATVLYRKNEFLFSSPLEFYAYPDLFDSSIGLSPDLYHAGNSVSDQKYMEDPFFISGIRPYTVGDPMRAINFKASARAFFGGSRQLMCNNFDSSRNYDSMIVLDLAFYPDAPINGEEQLEKGLRFACFLFCEALKNGGRVGFAANYAVGSAQYIHIPCGSGEHHTKNILKNFAEITNFAQRNYSMATLLGKVLPSRPLGTDLYLITPCADPKVAETLRMAERMGRNVCVIPLASRRGFL